MGASTHHIIVALETFFCPLPQLQLPPGHTFELHEHSRTVREDSEIQARVKKATILVITTIPLSAATLSESCTPNLKLIVAMASGTDSIDLDACRRRGITVCNSAHANVEAVSEHAIASYFAARRSMGITQLALRRDEWVKQGTLITMMKDSEDKAPLTCREETMGIIGFGAIGQRVKGMAEALGMKVIIAGRKGATKVDSDRCEFQELLEKSTVIFLCLPRTPDTINLLSSAEFKAMRRQAVVVNVSRGGIVDDDALITALRSKQIAGAAVDVFLIEPAGPSNTPLLAQDTEQLNLIVTPHTAWYAESTFENYQRHLLENLWGWCTGKPVRVIV